MLKSRSCIYTTTVFSCGCFTIFFIESLFFFPTLNSFSLFLNFFLHAGKFLPASNLKFFFAANFITVRVLITVVLEQISHLDVTFLMLTTRPAYMLVSILVVTMGKLCLCRLYSLLLCVVFGYLIMGMDMLESSPLLFCFSVLV